MVTNLKVQESPLNFLMDAETTERIEVTIEETTEIVTEETVVVSVTEEEAEIVILVEEENSAHLETQITVVLSTTFLLVAAGKILKIISVKQEMFALLMFVVTEMAETWELSNSRDLMISNGHSKN